MKQFALLLVLLPLASMAIDTGPAFDDPELQARYERIVEEVRCLKCQNQTIKDSNAFLAEDLRRDIRNMLEEGKTDAEIFDFLVIRYGEFALYRPRSKVLWILPGVFLVLGVLIALRTVRRRMALSIDDEEAADGR